MSSKAIPEPAAATSSATTGIVAPAPGRSSGARGLRQRDLWVAALLFASAFALYRATPRWRPVDSKYALLTSESLLRRGSWDLSPYLPAIGDPTVPPSNGVRPTEATYQLRRVGGRLLYLFPPGTPLLSAPLLPLLRPFGGAVVDAKGRYSGPGEKRMQALLAALLTALTVAWIYRISRYEVGRVEAVLVASLAACGSTLWTVASRTLWSHTWSVLLGAMTIEELLRWEEGRRRRPELLGLLVVALFWVRPTNSIVALAVAVYVLVTHRAAAWRLLATGAAGAGAYLTYSIVVWGEPLPVYVANGMRFETLRLALGRALWRQLFDPSIGWLVYSPILLAILATFAIRGVPAGRRRLAAFAAAIVAAHLLFYNLKLHGIGLGAPGPRLLTDLVPWLAWLGALALRARREAPPKPDESSRQRAATAALVYVSVAALAVLSVASHAEGAIRKQPGIGPSLRVTAGGKAEMIDRGEIVDYWGVLPQARLWKRLTRD